MRLGSCEIFAFVAFALSLSVRAFDDPISVIGRIRWNYTSYEENLWTRQYQNTTLEQIYRDHNEFIKAINSAYDGSDSFYPIVNTSAVDSIKNKPVIDSYLINPYHVHATRDVVVANEQVIDYWAKFANWSSFNTSNMLEVLTDDAIPTLQTSMDTLWNTTNTVVYFDFFKNKSEACTNMNQSQLAVYKLAEKYFINTIAIQLKAYVMLQLSYLTRATKDFLHFHKTARDQRVSFNYQYTTFTQQSENLMWNLSRVVWSCDNFNSNESYTQLTNFVQGYVDNEINLNADGSCMPYCSDFKATKNYGCKAGTLCAANYLDHNKTRCLGSVRDCDYFGPSFTYCSNEDDSDLNRRIDFVKLASGKLLGHIREPCDVNFEAKPFMTWMATCRYCFCYCDAPGPRSDRYFSLRDVTSNITENKVISGIRIVKKNRIIQLEAVERVLLPQLELDSSNDRVIANINFTVEDPETREHVDYFTMTYDNRTLNLDTIVAARDQLVTGVRFRVHSGAVHLEARFTYFDETTGKLDLETASEWKMNSNNQRIPLFAEHMDVPTRSTEQTRAIAADTGNSIKFVPTGWVRDMAQTTVPFIDSNLVEPPELVPLSGVGLIYKFQVGHGGYVAPKLVTHDYAAAAMRIRGAVGVYGV